MRRSLRNWDRVLKINKYQNLPLPQPEQPWDQDPRRLWSENLLEGKSVLLLGCQFRSLIRMMAWTIQMQGHKKFSFQHPKILLGPIFKNLVLRPRLPQKLRHLKRMDLVVVNLMANFLLRRPSLGPPLPPTLSSLRHPSTCTPLMFRINLSWRILSKRSRVELFMSKNDFRHSSKNFFEASTWWGTTSFRILVLSIRTRFHHPQHQLNQAKISKFQ